MADAAPRSAGPYEVLDPIGRGGMGVVYLARHRETQELAALKMVPVPRPDLLASLRREIDGLAALRHPGIVRIREHGLLGGLPWYAMDLVDGRTLREHVDAAFAALRPSGEGASETTPAPQGAAAWARRIAARAAPSSGLPSRRPPAGGGRLLELLSLARGLCNALAYMHGEGVVHRDLKPTNVLVTPGGAPVVVDFGLMGRFAASISRDALEPEGEIVGTIGYMAPEQSEGDLPDARVDLYALGWLLREIVTGRGPVQEPRDGARRLPALAAVPPSELVEGVPPELDRLIGRLLRRSPKDRLGYASEAESVLAALGAADPFHGTAPPAQPYLFRPSLTGRDPLIRKLRRDMAPGECGRLLLLSGESGVGKTRVAVALAAQAAEAGVLVLTGEPASGTTRALAILRRPLQAVADICRTSSPEIAARVLGTDAPILALYERSFSALPGAHDPVPILPDDAWRHRVATAVTGTLGRAAGDRSVLLVLDDLHLADELTLSWLRTVASGGAPPSFGVLGTYRSDVESAVAEIRGSAASHVSVGGLDEPAIASLVKDMLGTDAIPEQLTALLARHAAGSPFFVGEYLRMAVTEGLLRRDEHGWTVAAPVRRLPVPPSVGELVERRLRAIPETASRVLHAAAVIGLEMDQASVQVVSGVPEPAFWEGLRPLLARQLLEEVPPARLRFLHAELREAALAAIPSRELRLLHRRAADALEARGPVPEELLAEAARHWAGTGARAKARHYYARAAETARHRYALQDAEAALRAWIGLAGRPSRSSVQKRLELALDVLYRQGRMREALRESTLALADARACGDRAGHAAALRTMATAHNALGEMAPARRLYHRALREARALRRPRLEGIVLSGLAIHEGDRGNLEEELRLHERSLRLARKARDRPWQARELLNLSGTLAAVGDLARARQLGLQAGAITDAGDAPFARPFVLANLGTLEHRAGNLTAALDLYERTLAILKERGEVRFQADVLQNIGVLHLNMGRVERAGEWWQQALALHRAHDDRRNAAVCLTGIGIVHGIRGRPGEAETHLREAMETARRGKDLAGELEARHDLASLYVEWGRIEDAEALLARRSERGRTPRLKAMTLLLRGDLLAREGDAREGRRLMEAGIAELRRMGEGEMVGRNLVSLARSAQAGGDLAHARALLDESLASQRRSGNRRFEGVCLAAIAETRSMAEGPCQELLDLAAAAEQLIEQSGDEIELARARCIRAHLALALGEAREDLLEEARAARDRIGVTDRSDLARRVTRLELALGASRARRPLRAGYATDALPPGLSAPRA